MNKQRILVPSPDEFDTEGSIDLGSANRAVFTPFYLPDRALVTALEVHIITQNGNMDIGLYTPGGARLRSAGSTAVGAAGIQNFNITDILLAKGWYYTGVVFDGTTVKIRGVSYTLGATASDHALMGARQMAAALPLPAAATFAVTAVAAVPIVSLVLG